MFKVNWPKFSEDFIAKASEQMAVALNKGQKPNNIVGDIVVEDLNMGTKPPDLEILEIGELGEDRFKGIFKMTYAGDAHVILNTKVQANPLNLPRFEYAIKQRAPILAANQPLVVPMRLRISNLKLRGIIVLVIDKVKGTTLVFKNDPLEKVDVNSTFDGVASVRRFLQAQIEGQLRQMFQEDLPMLIHNLSLFIIQQSQDTTSMIENSVSSSVSIETVAEDNPVASIDDSQHSQKIPLGPVLNRAERLSDELVSKFISRPHHQKWMGNEPITVLESATDVVEMESNSIGAIVLHKSLFPERNLGGLELVTEEPVSLEALQPGQIPFRKPPSAANPVFPSTSPQPSANQLQSLDAVVEKPERRSIPSSPVISNRSFSNGLRIPVQIDHPINRFLSKTPTVDSNVSRLPASAYLSNHKTQQVSSSSIQLVSSQNDTSNSTQKGGSTAQNGTGRKYRSPASLHSLNIVHRSNISITSENYRYGSSDIIPNLRQWRDAGTNFETRGSHRQRYAPGPYIGGSLGSSESLAATQKATADHSGTAPITVSYLQPYQYHNQFHQVSNPSNEGQSKPLIFPEKSLVIQPSDNQVTAHLASLMLANHTISPVTHSHRHATFRASSGVPFSNAGANSNSTGFVSTEPSIVGQTLPLGSQTKYLSASYGSNLDRREAFGRSSSPSNGIKSSDNASSTAPSSPGLGPSTTSMYQAPVLVGNSGALHAMAGPATARKKVARHVRKLALPPGVPGISRTGSGLFGEPGVGQRTASSAGRTSSVGSGSDLLERNLGTSSLPGRSINRFPLSSLNARESHNANEAALSEDSEANGRSLKEESRQNTQPLSPSEASLPHSSAPTKPSAKLSSIVPAPISETAQLDNVASAALSGGMHVLQSKSSTASVRSVASVATIKAKKVMRVKSNSSNISVVSWNSTMSQK